MPFPGVVTELRKGNAEPLCEGLTQLGPMLLADSNIQKELMRLWLRAATDEKARDIFRAIGESLAKVRTVRQSRHPTETERRHAVAMSKSSARWLKRFQKECARVGERQARSNLFYQRSMKTNALRIQNGKPLSDPFLFRCFQGKNATQFTEILLHFICSFCVLSTLCRNEQF